MLIVFFLKSKCILFCSLGTPTMEKDDSESYEKEDGMEYKGVVYTIHPKP